MATAQPAPAAPTAPPPAPATPSPSSPTATTAPGWATSEFWLKLLAIMISSMLATGLIPSTSTAAQVAAIVMTMLGSLGYTAARTSAKNTTMRANVAGLVSVPGDAVTPPSSWRPAAIVGALMAGTLALTVPHYGATASPHADVTTNLNPITTSGLISPKGNCSVGDLGRVSDALVGANYAAAIDGLIAQLGAPAVRCDLLAVAAVTRAGKTSGAAALSPLELRAQEVLTAHRWASDAPTAATGSAVSP